MFGFLFGISLIAACASAPMPVHEYILDVKAQMLRGQSTKDDVPITHCATTACYVYEDSDVRKIKKYISENEIRLKDCKK